MYSYLAYGLGIHSTLPLPELLPAEVECDVFVHLVAHQELVPEEVLGKPWYLKVSLEEVILSEERVGVCLIRGGKDICIIPKPNADEREIQLGIMGVIMAFVLYQRGLLVLHASGITVEGGAVAFLGESGWGKSTMAAALHRLGYDLFTDDLVPVDTTTGSAKVAPGFPRLKLHPEATSALGCDINSLHLIHPLEEKLGYRISNGFANGSLELERIYVLAVGQDIQIERVEPNEAVVELLRHSYPNRVLHCGGAPHLLQCARIANQIPIYRLTRPKDFSLLPAVVSTVEEHFLNNNRHGS